jgi:L-lactate dehydrogenase complex protein LldF
MQPTADRFQENARAALADAKLQRALKRLRTGFIDRRSVAVGRLPEFDTLRDEARAIKDHTIKNLDFYLERFETKVAEAGGAVHWCRTAADAREAILNICRLVDARTVTKGKTMIGEEIEINEYLEANGMTPVETDLGEYIIQLRKEPPSHIIAPAIHVAKAQIEAAFREHHAALEDGRDLSEPSALLAEARAMLRESFLSADVGITGANFLVAETGSAIIVTNEGNGDLTQTLPRVHIVLASLEKVVPTLEDASTILRVLARSATGQEMSVYTTFTTGAKREGDLDGPEQMHVVLLDNGRSRLLGTEFEEVLRCIRCGACLNHCPVYGAIGGHAYGWVYSGPIGKVLTPALLGQRAAHDLPNASTFCGRCEEVCPMRIPLPKLMRAWREREFRQHIGPARPKWAVRLWGLAARHPVLYHYGALWASRLLRRRGGTLGRTAQFPFADAWTEHRDLPTPEQPTFQSLWSGPRRVKRRAAAANGGAEEADP